jgi:hypothetical protein
MMTQYDPYAWLCTAILFLWIVVRIFHPYKCENKYCGYWTYNRRHMFHHIQQKHYHVDSYTHKDT